MTTYNEKALWLQQSIESILAQTYKNIEFIIVIDNPSRNDLIDIVKNYAQKDKRIRYHINTQNQGLVYSLNKALSLATSEYIARMDADDIAHPERLEIQLKYLQDNDLDLIGSNINIFDANGIIHTSSKLLTHHYIKKMLSYGAINIVHPTFFGRKQMFDTLNGYADSPYTEDMDFLARALCEGYKAGNTKEVLLDCRYRTGSITSDNAFLIQIQSRLIVNSFNACLSDKQNIFHSKTSKNILATPEEIENFNRMKDYMRKAKKAQFSNNYISFLIYFIKANTYSFSALHILKINLYQKLFKLLEDSQLLYCRLFSTGEKK
jgi:glycosyltransferase involved in cell wall biosynthesis